ncbi:MAG: hypothetical protein EP146_18150 [Oscillibacter sp.]|uniref:hypothetical protein n=1 Tax=Oscillibacter sp. TaxID=1945593 RepID=UPI001329E4C9|nr:hypothetical protein [Oscillibacter sp.]MUU13050.1 hypothetical protein [Oscillibacter sp.]
MEWLPCEADNYVECVALVVEGEPLAVPHYQPDMGGRRPRQAIGTKEGGLPISSPRRPTPRRSCGTCWRPPAGTVR